MPLLEVQDVSVCYISGNFRNIGIKDYVIRKLTGKWHVEQHWANRHISFTLDRGESLGIVGRNGSGKSTLLRTIIGTLKPVEGHVKRNGTIAPILEIASGFDKDLTVMENIYLRGAILGYSRAFVDSVYDDIIKFAELEGFEYSTFGTLSSGMKSRLAFSILAVARPDILILDEVFSVGDMAFREKSSKKIQEIMDSGATTILVSHSLDQIRESCTKALWLDHGQMIAYGNTEEICDRYKESLNTE